MPLLETIRSQMCDVRLLDQALTHSSYDSSVEANYERLEFLGDSVLGFVIVEGIYKRFPRTPEGPLARLKSKLGSTRVLSQIAKEHGLVEAARFGAMPPDQLERARRSVGADLVEAVIGAVYLDRGFEAAKALTLAFVGSRIDEATLGKTGARDAKTTLHELVQGTLHDRPEYVILEETGPAHARRFHVEVRIAHVSCGRAWGDRRKTAEQDAAAMALKVIEEGEIDLAKLQTSGQ